MGIIPDDSLIEEALRRAREGDQDALGDLLLRFRDRLRRMVALRLNPRIQARVDASDVVQEACLEAARSLGDYLEHRPLPFYLWLRRLAWQRILMAHREHLDAQARDARRDVGLRHLQAPVSNESVAFDLTGHVTSPERAAQRSEHRRLLMEALDAMDPTDREVLVLRHIEQLSNVEAAEELGLQPSAASKRFVRALQRLQEHFRQGGGRFEDLLA